MKFTEKGKLVIEILHLSGWDEKRIMKWFLEKWKNSDEFAGLSSIEKAKCTATMDKFTSKMNLETASGSGGDRMEGMF